MAGNCTKCGALLAEDMKFCASCGAAVDASAQQYQQPQQQYQQPQQQYQQYDPQRDIADNKAMAILAYFIFFLPLLASPNSRFAKFHANQGLLVLIMYVAVGIASGILVFIPFVWMLSSLIYLGAVVIHILGIVNAAKGEFKGLPLIGGITLIKSE